MRGLIVRALVAAGAAVALLVPAAAASAAGPPVLGWTPDTGGVYDYGAVQPGSAVSQIFTLRNSGGSASAALTVTVTGSAFAKTADSCTGTSLGPGKSCTVTVSFSPAAAGQADTGTLTATGVKSGIRGGASVILRGAGAKATPAITTAQQPATGPVNTVIADQATVTGGSSPAGTVTFNLYDNPNCSGTPVFTDPNEALVNGVATGGGLRATGAFTGYWVATYNGDTNNNPVTSGCADEPVTITPAQTALTTTQQPATATVGTAIADQATLTGTANDVSGALTFKLYDNPNCSGTPLFTQTVDLTDGGTVTSAPYTATAVGTDYWTASYGGDSNNLPAATGCADEPVTINNPATPAITTSQQPASATVGSAVADQATVTGGNNPTGTVTFFLFPHADCGGNSVFADTEPLSGGTATSKGYTATATGTYYWAVDYNGDANNNPAPSGCNAEPVTITQATPAVTTSQQPATAAAGSTVADKATVTGGDNPAGTVTFDLYNNTTCSGTPLFTDTETLSGGTATSAGYTPAIAGTDYWVAYYNGDANNTSVTTSCADEPVTITGTADLTLSPGTYDAATDQYQYAFAPLTGGSETTTFIVTNSGTAASQTLHLDAPPPPPFSFTGDTCTNQVLAPGGTCRFDVTFSTAGCRFSGPYSVASDIYGSGGTIYILLDTSADCP